MRLGINLLLVAAVGGFRLDNNFIKSSYPQYLQKLKSISHICYAHAPLPNPYTVNEITPILINQVSVMRVESIPLKPLFPLLLGSIESANVAPSQKVVNAVENIVRVYKSLKYIEEDIENKGDAMTVLSEIKALLKNYNLKENVLISLDLVSKQKEVRNEAKYHGTSAVEDLTQVFEYFSDEIDNMSGRKFPPRQILTFAQEATKAARGSAISFFNI